MPRLARLDAPGVQHYIIIHGIECRMNNREDLERKYDLIPEIKIVNTKTYDPVGQSVQLHYLK